MIIRFLITLLLISVLNVGVPIYLGHWWVAPAAVIPLAFLAHERVFASILSVVMFAMYLV